MRRSLLALSLLAMLATPRSVAGAPPGACSRVLGFSNTAQWYKADGTNLVSGYETRTGHPEAWESQARAGQELSEWAIGGSGWSGRVNYPSCSGRPTAAVLQIGTREIEGNAQVDQEIADAIAGIHLNLPPVTHIDLMPVQGGPALFGGKGCGTYSERIQPQMLAAAQRAANASTTDDVFLGAVTGVTSCDQFSDSRGHMTVAGATIVAQQVRDFYYG